MPSGSAVSGQAVIISLRDYRYFVRRGFSLQPSRGTLALPCGGQSWLGIWACRWKIYFWQWPGPACRHSMLSEVSSLMNIGMGLGAAMLASVSGQLRQQSWPSGKQLLAAAIGGILMGIGARLSFGCNIGAFLGGIASGSVHGWVWFVLAMAGSWAGVYLRPSFGLSK